MSRKKITIFVTVVAFLAISIAITFFMVAPRSANASGTTPTTLSLAFSALVTTGKAQGTPITGGLTEVVQSTGYFNGNLHLPEGYQISTNGKLDNGKITISFYNAIGAPTIVGTGKLTKAGNFVGTFKVLYKNKDIDKGIWSALPIAQPNQTMASAVAGIETNNGVGLSGALVLDSKTLVGTLNLANGTMLPVSAKFLTNSYYSIKFSFDNGAILAYGRNVENPINTLNKAYAGPFKILSNGHEGKWIAYSFGF